MKKIKIIKAKFFDLWYVSNIGAEFEVKEFPTHPDVWWTSDFLPILKKDAQVLESSDVPQ